MAEYKYKFSVVTAVYNVELFVAETIDSIIAQDIGPPDYDAGDS